MNSVKRQKYHDSRLGSRFQSVREISLSYEGHSEEVLVRPPDLSRRGMFISTMRIFPEGAVLNLRFRLAVTGVSVQTRCEVRHCLAGVGVGVEFVGLSAKVAKQIDREIARCEKRPVRQRDARKKARTPPRAAKRAGKSAISGRRSRG